VCVDAMGKPVSKTTGADTRDAGGRRAPAVHRASPAICPMRGPGTGEGHACPMSAQSGCQRDSDCTDGVNGRCLAYGGPACLTGCSYDTCESDADCPSNQVCDCRGMDSNSDANVCVPADCRSDADCGPGEFCSPSVPRNGCSCPSAALCTPGDGTCSPGPCLCGDSCQHSYTCHTAADECSDDSDCGGAACAYDIVEKRWECHVCIGPI
jgi:hypothetical protein